MRLRLVRDATAEKVQNAEAARFAAESSARRLPVETVTPNTIPPERTSASTLPTIRVDPSACAAARTGSTRVISVDQGGQDAFVGDVYVTQGAPGARALSFGGWGDHYYDYLRFDLPGDWATRAARTAVLCLFATAVPRNDPQLEIRMVGDRWDQAGLSITSRPTHGTTGICFGTAVAGWNAVDVSSIVARWASGRAPNHGIVLLPKANNQTNGAFASGKADDRDKRPRLILNR